MELLASFACEENDEEYKTFCLTAPDIAPAESTILLLGCFAAYIG